MKRHGYNDNLTRLVRQGRIDEAIVSSEPIKIEGNTSAAHKRDGALEHDEKCVEGRNEVSDDAMAHRLLQRNAKHLPRHWLVHKKEYRDVLFEFLHHNVDEITQVAWNFIMKLPTNPDDLESIRSFQGKPRLIGVKYLARTPSSGWFIIYKS